METTSLEVEADGMRIGYLQFVNEYTLAIWDDAQDLLFSVNDSTGFVAGGSGVYYFINNNCNGTRYTSAPVPTQVCAAAPAPLRKRVWGTSTDTTGFIESGGVETTIGEPLPIVYKSLESAGMCVPADANMSELCVLEVTGTIAIPTAFPLPIAIVEAAP